MTSSYSSEKACHIYDSQNSETNCNKNSFVFNIIENSQSYGINDNEDVKLDYCSENLKFSHGISNVTIDSETCEQDTYEPITSPQMTDLLSTNNAMGSLAGMVTPFPTHTPIDPDNSHSVLNNLRINNLNRIIFAHININSIRNKFDMLADMIAGKVDILLVTETKIDETFPSSQFLIPGYATPFRADRSINGGTGGGMLLYIREDMPSKVVCNKVIHPSIECFFVEINLHKKKWLIGSTYNPSKDLISKHVKVLSTYVDEHLQQYENIIIMGDFNSEPLDTELKEFCEIYCLKNLVKDPTCYKNPENPSCIDLISNQ